jgi:hypothetical protein
VNIAILWSGYSAGEELDVLILGSWPPPFLLRFCIRDVDEKGDVWDGILCERHCGDFWKAEGMRFVCVKGRKTGRKLERFIVVCGVVCWWL